MPTVLIMIAKVAIVVTFIKVLAAKFNLVVSGVWALIVAILSSVGVWYYYIATTETAITTTMIVLLGEVILGSTIGYKLLPRSIKEFDLKNLRGEVLNRGSGL